MTAAERVDQFEELRPQLLAVAYRLTGTFADAEDVVQDAWLRWNGASAAPADLRAWLTTVVSRLSLDRLRSAARRRETYVGEWLPEPVVTPLNVGGPADPLAVVVSRDDARFAAMVVLERLSPDQRVAFVLHDGFAVPFPEIAAILGVSDAAARQLASRARRIVSRDPAPAGDPDHDEVVGKFLAAMASGDVDAVIAVLHPDVTLIGDANGKARTAIHVIRGPDKVARFLFGLTRRYGPAWAASMRLALVNGELGVYSVGELGRDGYEAVLPRIDAMTVRDGKVFAMWDIANPDKFTASPLRRAVASVPSVASRESGMHHQS
jgi:RNA polymerase sigma-70 factor, ECF subfamily